MKYFRIKLELFQEILRFWVKRVKFGKFNQNDSINLQIKTLIKSSEKQMNIIRKNEEEFGQKVFYTIKME